MSNHVPSTNLPISQELFVETIQEDFLNEVKLEMFVNDCDRETAEQRAFKSCLTFYTDVINLSVSGNSLNDRCH